MKRKAIRGDTIKGKIKIDCVAAVVVGTAIKKMSDGWGRGVLALYAVSVLDRVILLNKTLTAIRRPNANVNIVDIKGYIGDLTGILAEVSP